MSLEQALIEGVKVRLSKCLGANAAIELRRGAQEPKGDRLKFVWTKFSTLSWDVFVISVISWHKQARPHLELKIQFRFHLLSLSMAMFAPPLPLSFSFNASLRSSKRLLLWRLMFAQNDNSLLLSWLFCHRGQML